MHSSQMTLSCVKLLVKLTRTENIINSQNSHRNPGKDFLALAYK